MNWISFLLIILAQSFSINVDANSKLNNFTQQNEDLFLAREGNKVGYVNNQGKVITPLQFEEGDEFFENFARVKINKKWGFIDNRNGKIIWQARD
jgi:WG containing repeat